MPLITSSILIDRDDEVPPMRVQVIGKIENHEGREVLVDWYSNEIILNAAESERALEALEHELHR